MKKSKKKKTIKIIIPIFIVLIVVIISILIMKNNKKTINTTANKTDISEEISKDNNEEENQSEEETQNEVKNVQKSKLEEKLATGKTLSEDGLPVLMYHFFYDKNQTDGKEKDGNWVEISNFEKQMSYLAENDYYYPTWQEVEDYIDGKQELPEKSVVITVDDGDDSFFELAVPILQKYNVQATSFLVTYWYGYRANDKQANVDYQSHSYDMHKAGADGKGVMLSWNYDQLKEDVLLSSEVLGGANIFCYPFSHYNALDIQVLQDTGYKLAFTTLSGRVKKGASKYELPRVRIDKGTGLLSFINKVK